MPRWTERFFGVGVGVGVRSSSWPDRHPRENGSDEWEKSRKCSTCLVQKSGPCGTRMGRAVCLLQTCMYGGVNICRFLVVGGGRWETEIKGTTAHVPVGARGHRKRYRSSPARHGPDAVLFLFPAYGMEYGPSRPSKPVEYQYRYRYQYHEQWQGARFV